MTKRAAYSLEDVQYLQRLISGGVHRTLKLHEGFTLKSASTCTFKVISIRSNEVSILKGTFEYTVDIKGKFFTIDNNLILIRVRKTHSNSVELTVSAPDVITILF